MKKLFFTLILLFTCSIVWADFDPTKDTPPAVLPENIHPVQGKEKNDKGVLDNPTFVLNNEGVKYEWYKYSTTTNKYEYTGTRKGVTNNKYQPFSEGKYMCVVDASPLPITELFEFNSNPQPSIPQAIAPVIKQYELTPCKDDTIVLNAEKVADRLEWVMIKDGVEQSLPEAFNKETYQVYCPKIASGETLYLRNKIIYYREMTLSKNLIENGDFEDVTIENNHYKGFSSSYNFYGVDVPFPSKVSQNIKDENGNDVTTYPGYYHICTKGMLYKVTL
jgi:hypothetical protein